MLGPQIVFQEMFVVAVVGGDGCYCSLARLAGEGAVVDFVQCHGHCRCHVVVTLSFVSGALREPTWKYTQRSERAWHAQKRDG